MRAADAAAAKEAGRVAVVVGGDRPGFVAFVADEATETALRGALTQLPDGMQIRRGNIRTAAKALEREPTPIVLLVDIAGIEDPIAALDDLAAVCTPDVKVLVVGDREDIGFYRDLTRDMGIAEYACKPLTRDTVASLFGPHLAGAEADSQSNRGGRVVAVCGVRGGVGATTVAVNLALQLAATSRGHVALLDLHLRGGTAAMMLGARPSAGLRVALEEPGRVDALFLDRVATTVEDRVRLIAAEEPLEAEVKETAEGAKRLIELLRQRFNHIIVDLPVPPGPAERQTLAMARQVVLVLSPDVAGVRDAVAARKFGVAGAGGSITVLNRSGMPGALKPKMVAEGLGAEPDVVIPDLPRQLPRAANLGRPALRESSAFRRALAPLTQEISGVQAERGASLLGRLFGKERS
jgi:pilus assembly protein CpaE